LIVVQSESKALHPSSPRLPNQTITPSASSATPCGVAANFRGSPQWRWRARERVGDVDLTSPDPDQILVIECDQGIVERRRGTVRRGPDDVLDWDRPTALEESAQDEPGKGLLASRPPRRLPFKRIQGLELVRRHDR
jgi:hypothetical protein